MVRGKLGGVLPFLAWLGDWEVEGVFLEAPIGTAEGVTRIGADPRHRNVSVAIYREFCDGFQSDLMVYCRQNVCHTMRSGS